MVVIVRIIDVMVIFCRPVFDRLKNIKPSNTFNSSSI